MQAGRRIGRDPVGSGVGAGLAQQVRGALGHRQQAHHALGLVDDAPGPAVQVDPHRLREAAHHVERQIEALRGTGFLVGVPVVAVLAGIGGLQRP